MSLSEIHICPLVSVAGVPFGTPTGQLQDILGPPDEALWNYTGEHELLYRDSFYRFVNDRFVEATFPDRSSPHRPSPHRSFTHSNASPNNLPHANDTQPSVSDKTQFFVNEVAVLSPFDWLAGQADVRDIARFRISLRLGLAYDYRNPTQGSVTVFEAGRWDALVLGNAR